MRVSRWWLILLVGMASAAHGQSVHLSARLNGSVFFEGEPIYLLVELHNTGPDTVWITPIDFVSGELRGWVMHNEERVPEFVVTADWVYGPDYKGVGLAPGESTYATQGLLSRWGYPGDLYETLFLQNLPPGDYIFSAALVPVPRRGGVNQRLATQLVPFSVRSRSATEEQVYRAVQRLGEVKASAGRRAGFLTELIAWCRDRLTVDSADLFVPYLMRGGVAIAAGMLLRPSPSQTSEILGLQSAVARRHRSSPAGAFLLDAEPLRASTQVLETLASPSDSSLLAAVLEARRRRNEK